MRRREERGAHKRGSMWLAVRAIALSVAIVAVSAAPPALEALDDQSQGPHARFALFKTVFAKSYADTGPSSERSASGATPSPARISPLFPTP